MKRLLFPLLAALALPTAVNATKFDPDAHQICLEANDYIGCMINNSSSNSQKSYDSINYKNEIKYYIDNFVKIIEIESTTNFNGLITSDTDAIKFAIKNLGDRTLNRVEVKVYFFNDLDNIFYEEKYIPVSTSRYFDSDEPLKPNYTHRMSGWYTLDNLGTEWSGKIKVEVSNITFAK